VSITYYHRQLLKMREELYPKDYLCRQVIQAKQYIDLNFAQRIDLHQIAGEAFFSTFHFIRLFKKLYGQTPHQYLTYVRIDNAKKILCLGTSVSDTCFAVGFSSSTSFATLFKKISGLSPSSYYEKIRHTEKQF